MGAALVQGVEVDHDTDCAVVAVLPVQLDSVSISAEETCLSWMIRMVGVAGAAVSVTPPPPRTASRDATSAKL
jgi:hypothetical protein